MTVKSGTIKLACKGVWKLFGDHAERLLATTGGAPDDEALRQAGVIGAVRDASLEVHEGEIFIIMGLSGSGKSTLVRCLSRLIEPTAGEVLFEGQDLLQANERELMDIRRHKMGMVFQHFALLPHLSVLGNVAFPLEIQGIDRATREARAIEMIDLVGLKAARTTIRANSPVASNSVSVLRAAWPWGLISGFSTNRSPRLIRSSGVRCRMSSCASKAC